MKKRTIIFIICAVALILTFSFWWLFMHRPAMKEGEPTSSTHLDEDESPTSVSAEERKLEIDRKIHRTGLKLLMIGLDAADWQIIDPLMEKGKLQNIQKLIQNGVRADLRSVDPMMSPLLWTTMATGKTPDLHGIADFLVYDPAAGRKVPITSNFRKSKALWNILSDFDIRSAFIAWWASYPAERINGVMVTELVGHSSLRSSDSSKKQMFGLTYPPEYFDEVKPKLRSLDDITYSDLKRFIDVTPEEFEDGKKEALKPPPKDDEGAPLPAQNPVALMLKTILATENYQRIALDILDRKDCDFVSVYFEGIDMVGHRFQHLMSPKMKIVSDEEYRKYNRAVNEFYIFQDELLHDLIMKASKDTVIMVISDHGFRNGADRPDDILPYTTNQPVEWHREYGIFILSGPSITKGDIGRLSLFDVFPTTLAVLGLPQAADTMGHVPESAFLTDFFQEYPLRSVDTYEGFGERTMSAYTEMPVEAQEEMLENLRALGYIGAQDTRPSRKPSDASSSGSGQTSQELDTNATYHRNLATFFMKQGDLKKAEEQLLMANEKKKLPKTYEMLAEIYAHQNRIEDAIQKIEEGFKEFPTLGDDDVLWIVELRLQQGDLKKAMMAFENWKARIKTGSIKNACLGRLAEAQGYGSDAERYYRASLDEDPMLVSTALKLFSLLDTQGKWSEIEPYVRKALSKSDRIDEYHNLLGLLHKRRGNIQGAIEEFQKALELYPDSEIFLFNLGSAFMAAGDWRNAQRAFESGASLGSGNPSLWINLGSTYFQMGEMTKALDAYQRAINFGAPGSAAHYGMALAYTRLKRTDNAIEIAREGLTRNPGDENLKKLYSDLLKNKNP